MPILRDKTDLDKKPTWYIFLAANVVVLLGCAITYILFSQTDIKNTLVIYVPCIVCNIIALILCGFFIWIEARTTMPKAVHFQRKWLWWYLAAMIVFVCSIIFNFIFLIVFNLFYWPGPDKQTWPLIIYIVVTGVLTLIAIGLQRYARYKIDLDIYRRKHGELPKKKEIEKDQKKASKAKDDKPTATSGLADSIGKQ
ncbi:MAG: DUF5453 family protein [Mycoplasma sp.]|nr:DUF5453 family protein [Candidatus Hennigella equi]